MSDNAEVYALHGGDWSLVVERQAGGSIVWRHLGLRVEAEEVPRLPDLRGATTFSIAGEPAMHILPVAGAGWFGPPALIARDEAGHALDLTFDTSQVDTDESGLAITLDDTSTSLRVVIEFRTFGTGGLQVSQTVHNVGSATITIDQFASASVPLPSSASSLISRRGRHGSELAECREAMPAHGWQREVRQGMTGHGGPPAIEVLCGSADRHVGTVVSGQFAWSGDSRLSVERTDEGFAVLQAEAVLRAGEKRLAPGESWSAPPFLLAISTSGRNGAMQCQHSMVREIVDWPGEAMAPRPVHLNSWEAVYFSHDAARIEKLSKAAVGVGAERFILDDGWFKGRNSDDAGLGDWIPDPAKYPHGLAPLADKLRKLGMEFGLWVEPEMVNADSDLYRAHPDWVLGSAPLSRNQLVLDMRRKDVRDYLFDRLHALLNDLPISNLKWDHNRAHAPAGGAAQTDGSYALLARVREAHPKVEIEACAAGGGRIDAGMAHYAHRFWTSDNIDAVSRIAMQRSFLSFMPPELMGAHVGASPSHATGRSQSLDFRAAIACQGHFGIELDPDALGDQDRERLAHWTAFYKQWRSVIHGGEVYLGDAPHHLAWQAQGDGSSYLVWVVRSAPTPDRRDAPLALPFARGRDWTVTLLEKAGHPHVLAAQDGALYGPGHTATRYSGSWLAHAGLPLPALAAETAAIFHLEAR